MYHCYFIVSDTSRTYIGITNNLEKRIQQHNKVVKGGAKSTRSGNNWKYHTIVGPFITKSKAMQFEWQWKHDKTNAGVCTRSKPGIINKIKKLNELLESHEWSEFTAQNNLYQ